MLLEAELLHQEQIITPKICPLCNTVYAGELSRCLDDGAVFIELKGYPSIGTIFAERYEIQALLGFGGMSIVYRARHKHMGRTVAIKVLHPDLVNDPYALERFEQESRAAATLNHPNIVTVYDFGMSARGQAFFVMDCLDGPTLEELLESNGILPAEKAVSVFKQICDGLDSAHRKGIVHRDLKPPNIALLRNDDGSDLVKILDFGVAKFINKAAPNFLRLTKTGEIFGSPLYMSPEQCLGKELDGRSDIYAFGCLMYEVLTGSPVIIAESFLEALNKHVGETPKSFKEVAPFLRIPKELEDIVFKCLMKAPEQRFQNVNELREELSHICFDQPGASNKIRTKNQTNSPLLTLSRAINIDLKIGPKLLSYLLPISCGLLLGMFAFFAFWPGSKEDPGTPLAKLSWQIAMSAAQSCYGWKNYDTASQCTQFAKSIAQNFGDNHDRLIDTLNMEAKILQESGQYSSLRNVNYLLSKLRFIKIEQNYSNQLALLRSFAREKDPVQRERDAITLRSKIETIFSAASDLASIEKFADQQILLKRCKQVLGNLNVRDVNLYDRIDLELADGLAQQQRAREAKLLPLAALDLSNNKSADRQTRAVEEAFVGTLVPSEREYKQPPRALREKLPAKHTYGEEQAMAYGVRNRVIELINFMKTTKFETPER